MQKNSILACIVTIFFVLSPNGHVGNCWDAETHKLLTNAAAWKSSWYPSYASWGIDLHEYLRFWHGIGANTNINGRPARDWINKGSVDEDNPIARSLNHFHDPLKPWDKAGYSAMGLPWMSSILWSQTSIGQQFFAWKNARQYYYRALSAPTDAERNLAYALTFQAMGHIMHSIEDAAVPDHTRNDAHIFFSVEKWAIINNAKTREFISYATYWNALPQLFSLPIRDLVGSRKAPVRIANLIDSDEYTGTNPEITLSPTIGIAEYTNANFLSIGTVFTYNHPALSSTQPGSTKGYLKKYTAGEAVDHFLVAGPDWPTLDERTYDLDDRCHENYAKLLLPKAAQYAAAIPQYFFRAIIYGLHCGGKYSYAYNDSDEVMKDGVIEIYASKDGVWTKIGWTPSGTLEPQKGVVIPLKCDDVCWNEYPGYWTVVFRGTLGSEEGAVVGNLHMFCM